MNLNESFVAENLSIVYHEQVTTAAKWIAFNPVFWTIFSQLELRTHLLTKRAGGRKRLACYAYGAFIFLIGLYRDFQFHQALDTQPVACVLDYDLVKAAGCAMFAAGCVLVFSSMYRLGVTGTYYGDHFGILLRERITSFPFNVTENPMYVGSFLSFLGTALYYGKSVGIFLSIWVWIMYELVLRFEGPYTARIYAQRNAEKASMYKGPTYSKKHA